MLLKAFYLGQTKLRKPVICSFTAADAFLPLYQTATCRQGNYNQEGAFQGI